MTNITYKVKTQANMKICQEEKFRDIYKGGEVLISITMSR